MADIEKWEGCVAITGMGLVTPVGLTAPASLAAMRAGISRIGELPWFEVVGGEGEMEPVKGAQVPFITEGRWGPSRLLRLTEPPLKEALSDANLKHIMSCTMYLGTAASHAGDRVLEFGLRFKREIAALLPNWLESIEIRLVEAGRAAALQAIRIAVREMDNNSCDIAIVGGVDSWISPRSLMFLQDTGRLREGRRSTGILPGEAAGFLVLEKIEHALNRGAQIKATLLAAAGGHESTPLDKPSRAEVLSAVFKRVGSHVKAPAPLIISDLNGERHRSIEWALAGSRGLGPYQESFRHWHPAEYIGDPGAASSAVGVGWAATALHKGYAYEGRVLVWGASDEGAREAVLVGLARGGG